MPTVSLVQITEDGELIPEEILTFEVAEGSNLWTSLDEQNHELPSGCLAGSCGSCRISILEGHENISDLSVIEKDTIDHLNQSYLESHGEEWLKDKSLRLACRTKVNGNMKFYVMKK